MIGQGGKMDILEHTPAHVAGQRRRAGGFSTLVEGLEFAARTAGGFNFHAPRGALEQVLSFARLAELARERAGKLVAAGLKRGERVALMAETTPDFMITFFACQYAGMLPCPVPLPMQLGGRDSHARRVAGMLRAARARALLVSASHARAMGEAACAGGAGLLVHEEIAALPEHMDAIRPLKAEEPAYIQYSSGSTSDPKGILISQRAITTNTTAILRDGLRIGEEDRAFSWLPLYHDMGLVGFFLAPLMGQVSVDYLATQSFAKRPALWLELMSRNASTISFAPTFGYELAARRIGAKAEELDLSRWRVAGIGGDMVRVDILERFADALAPAGFRREAFLPSYGMAEMSLAISFHDLHQAPRTDVIDRRLAQLQRKAVPIAPDSRHARRFASCGRVLPGHELKVVDAHGRELPERAIGHIWVKGPSMMGGYFQNPAASAVVMKDDGFMDTGDLGYMLDGEIYITGRAKDLILYHGRNIWPQDIEWAVERLQGVRSGDVAAFTVEREDGAERIVVLVQCRSRDAREQARLRREVAAAVHRALGVECDVVLVERRALPMTSSGKLARARARALYLAGEMPLCATRRGNTAAGVPCNA